MLKRISNSLFTLLPLIIFLLAFNYIFKTIEPKLIFHHLQPPFILASDFIHPYLKYPGGIAQLAATFIMQAFYYKYFGTIVLFAVALVFYCFVFLLINKIHKNKLNLALSFAPFLLSIVMANNYNFPYSVIVSVVFVLLFLLVLLLFKKGFLGFLFSYIIGALLIYYVAGSGYLMLFSAAAILLFNHKKWLFQIYMVAFIIAFATSTSWLAVNYIFTVPLDFTYFYFFTPNVYFVAFKPGTAFYIFILSVPFLIILVRIFALFDKNNFILQQAKYKLVLSIAGYLAIAGLAFYCHQISFNPDEKKIVEADYYSYHNQVGKTENAATTLEKYSFEANLNYNLVLSKTGNLTDKFFNFFQISGVNSLFPDNRFQSEMSFIAAEYYYDLGFISEARHWANESLVNFPHSIRALQLLVKIHLVLHEYDAAERCINILKKGIIGENFIAEFEPFVRDTSLIGRNSELMEKRNFITGEYELSTSMLTRLQELLQTNKNNKKAFEQIMLYYLLDGDLESFTANYKNVGFYFDKPVAIYEDALLMYGALHKIPVKSEYNISETSVSRFVDFNNKMVQYKENSRLALNELYPKFGTTYLYYLQLIYPRILKPENSTKDDTKPAF